MNRRVVKGDASRAEGNLDRIKIYSELDFRESKCRELEDFGISRGMIKKWDEGKNPEVAREYGKLCILLNITREIMQRLRPGGTTGLGLYINSIKEILQAEFKQGTVLDFGCGSWIDASLSLVMDSDLTIQLLDIFPLALSFASYQLTRRNIKHKTSLVMDKMYELDLIEDNPVMVVESTSFEHVKDIRHLFGSLIDKLPKGGFFLTNYTRLDWTNPAFDGHKECHDFVEDARWIASESMLRYEWDPPQKYWDLWRKK